MIEIQRNNTPEKGSTGVRGVQFLKPSHVTNPKGNEAKIYKVTTDKPDNFSNPYVVFFEMNGGKYSKGFKPTSDNLHSLVDLFGADEKKWIGKKLLIVKQIGEDEAPRLAFKKYDF